MRDALGDEHGVEMEKGEVSLVRQVGGFENVGPVNVVGREA